MNMFRELNPVGIVIIALIAFVFLTAFILNLLIRHKYIVIQNDLQDWQRKKDGDFQSDILKKVIDDYRNTALVNYNEVNTQAIIEKVFSLRLRGFTIGERFIRNANSILITLGLLGTFIGLTIAVGNISNEIQNINIAEITANGANNFLGGLLSSLGGMSVAFLTSLVGIASSILLTLLLTIINAEEARETLMVHIEEYLDNTVSLVIAKDKETEYTMMNRILKETFTDFGSKIQDTLKGTVESFADKLTTVVMDVNVSSQTLDSTVDRFDSALTNFSSNMKDLSEFNMNMRNNIERMDVNFIKVTEALTKTSNIVVENYSSIEGFSDNIRAAATEMTSYNRQIIDDISKLVKEVEASVSMVKRFAEAMDSDVQSHARDLQKYQESITLLVTKLGNEIGTLGQHAALSFADALATNSKELTTRIKDSIEGLIRDIFTLLESFKENEKILARTIASLPDQTLAYNEASVSMLGKQLDDLKDTIQRTLK